MVPLPDDVTVADLNRAFTERTTPTTEGGVTYTSTRSEPGGPYRVSFARSDAAAGELGRVVLSPTVDGRHVFAGARNTTGRAFDAIVKGLAGVFLVVAVVLAPLNDWHLTPALICLGVGVAILLFALVLSRATRVGEVQRAVRAATAAFEVARRAATDVTARDDGDQPASPR